LKGFLLKHDPNRFDTIICKLKDNGYKITPQRIAIVKILAKSVNHPSAEAIYEQLKENFPTMSLATVYRNLCVIKSLDEVLNSNAAADLLKVEMLEGRETRRLSGNGFIGRSF